jgi:hypothetical protein
VNHEEDNNLSRSTALLILVAILVVAYVSRIFFASACYTSTFDTGTPKLMALDILQGNAYPIFFYGQSYFGALEAYGGALIMLLMGPTEMAMVIAVSLFTLLWIWSSYLLFSELFNRAGGLAAAAVLAVPGVQLTWYTVASYGGYPVVFWTGTMVLWLAVRIQKRMPEGRALLLHTCAMGIFIALGIWTHSLVAPYILTAGGVLLFYLNRQTILYYISAGCIGACGFVPGYLVHNVYADSGTSKFVFTGDHLKESFDILINKNLPLLAWWNPIGLFDVLATPIVRVIALILLIFALGFFIYTLIRRRSMYLLVPLVFLLLFLGFYLPHDMATVKAPRYVFPFWTLFICTLFAYPLSRLGERSARLSLLPLVGFLVFQAVGEVAHARRRAPAVDHQRAWAQQSIADARALGCDVVFMVGDPIFGHRGQYLSFMAGNDPVFRSAFDERRLDYPSSSEPRMQAGYLCQPGIEYKVAESLRVMGVPERRQGSVFGWKIEDHLPGKSIQATNQPALFDRVFETSLTGVCGADALLFELPKTCRLTGFWLTDTDPLQLGLPENYDVAVSMDGETWQTILECRGRIAVSSFSQALRFKGYMSMQETRFEAVEAKWLKILPLKGQGSAKNWSVNEVVLFEHLLQPVPVKFSYPTVPYITLPYNPKYTRSSGSRKLTTYDFQNWGFEVLDGMAEETSNLLARIYGANAITRSSPNAGYTLFELPGGSDLISPLMWNGHFLVESADPHRRWH